MGAHGEEAIAIGGAESGDALGIEAGLLQGGFGIREISVAEGVVGLEPVEATVERIAGSGRKPVVERDGTGHVTTALPWCQEGS